ncbi:hypothetical protein GCM10008019_28300 [Deinococcus soli (ex Cha et al. 2016)]|nr:hypothetical protein GCM10008019_28300 [Deinococcus soli (ex Cha et al. 2016)]
MSLILRVIASVEFGPTLGVERPTREYLTAFALQVDRHAAEVALLSGRTGLDVAAQGQVWYDRLTQERDHPVQVAYHAMHMAAYLGLEQAELAATMLAVTAEALRVLARREGRVTH